MEAKRSAWATAPAAALLLLAGGAQAQSACEQFKATLAARIDPSIRNFSMEAVPADTPVPPGAKVIGTCEGGAQKILFRRTAGPTAAPSPAAADAPAADAASPVPAPAPAVTPGASAPARAAPRPVAVAASAPAPRPAPAAPVAREKIDTGSRSEKKSPEPAPVAVEPARTVERVETPPPKVPPAQAEPPTATSGAFGPRWRALVSAHWPWLTGAALVALAAWFWAWWSRRSAYDEAGLPRGPRLN